MDKCCGTCKFHWELSVTGGSSVGPMKLADVAILGKCIFLQHGPLPYWVTGRELFARELVYNRDGWDCPTYEPKEAACK